MSIREAQPHEQLESINEARSQYHWAIANIVIAFGCVVLAALAFAAGYIVAGLSIIVVSFALVINAGSHK